jgi:hypothetical protein
MHCHSSQGDAALAECIHLILALKAFVSAFTSPQIIILIIEPYLYWQRKLLPLQHLRVVNPEEVRIQQRLHNPRKHTNRLPVSLPKIPIDPIRDVQRPVAP